MQIKTTWQELHREALDGMYLLLPLMKQVGLVRSVVCVCAIKTSCLYMPWFQGRGIYKLEFTDMSEISFNTPYLFKLCRLRKGIQFFKCKQGSRASFCAC